MTLTTLTTRVTYPGAGSVGPYAFPFRIQTAADLRVVIRGATGVETVLTVDTDYTIAGILNATGTVTLTTALAVGDTLVLRRAPALTQPTSIQNQGAYFAKTHEDVFDRTVMQLLSVNDLSGRSIGVSESFDPAEFSLRVRPETGKVLAWQSETELGNALLDASATALPGRGRTVTSLSAYLLNNAVFNVKDYGAVGGYVSRPLSLYFATLAAAQVVYPHAVALSDEIDWAAIQMAINQAQALFEAGVTTGVKVLVPQGTYLVNRPVTVAPAHGFQLVGEGMTTTAIIATAVMTQTLKLGDTTAQLADMLLADITVDAGPLRPGGGAPLASYAIYGSRVDNSVFRHVRANGASVANCSMGYGYTMQYFGCRWTSGTGDGFTTNNDAGLGQSNNSVDFFACLSLGNTGFGYRLRSGYGNHFFGGNIEQCAKGGIFVTRQVNGLVVHGIYFEGNASAGHVLSAVTVRGHIVLNGAVDEATMSGTFPSAGVSISGCFVSSHGYANETFVSAAAVDGIQIVGNQGTPSSGSAIPLLTAYVNPTVGSVANVVMAANQGFATDEVTLVGLPTDAATKFRRWRSDKTVKQNYAETDFLRWVLISAGVAGGLRRSSSTYRGQPVWEINHTATGAASNNWGFQLDMALYPSLQGKVVYLSAWVSQTDATGGATLYCNGNSSAAGISTNFDWRFVEVAAVLPASGVVSFGFYDFAATNGKVARITEPVLSLVGAPADDLLRIGPHQRVWWGSAVPAAGTWVVGDRVQNRVPAAGSPKGWLCTVAGAPGTWVSEGNL